MTAITGLDQVSESRVCWPPGKPRSAQRQDSPFRPTEIATEQQAIEVELERWRVSQWIISRNNQRMFAGDPAAALWWNDRAGQLRVLACDKYNKLPDNLHAIRLTLAAMRALERWGTYTAEQAAEGALAALPPPSRPWREVLGVAVEAPLIVAEGAYRALARRAGEGGEALPELIVAIEAARRELR